MRLKISHVGYHMGLSRFCTDLAAAPLTPPTKDPNPLSSEHLKTFEEPNARKDTDSDQDSTALGPSARSSTEATGVRVMF